MGMSTHIVGIKPPDDTWKKMKAIHDACLAAGLGASIPKEVEDYFNNETPDAMGVVVDLEDAAGVLEYRTESHAGFSVDLRKLPPDIKILRFWNAY